MLASTNDDGEFWLVMIFLCSNFDVQRRAVSAVDSPPHGVFREVEGRVVLER